MSRRVGLRPLPSPPTITPSGRCSGIGAMRPSMGVPATGTSPWSDAANTMMAFPVILEVQTLINKFFWANGSAAGGNYEVVLYDDSFSRVGTSTGSQGGVGNSVPQSFAPSGGAFTVPPGVYYCAIAHDDTTTNRVLRYTATLAAPLFMAQGCWKQAVTLGSLPSPATPADLTSIGFPFFGIITRTVFDV